MERYPCQAGANTTPTREQEHFLTARRKVGGFKNGATAAALKVSTAMGTDTAAGLSPGADGSRYEGEHRDGKRHGRGTLIWASGQSYEGEWRNGKPHGQGTCTDAEVDSDGTLYTHRYEVEWREWKWHGWGVRTHSVLSKLDDPDKRHASHRRYEGGFSDGKVHGRGTVYSAREFISITSETGNWSRYDGEWRVSAEGLYRDGKAHGRMTIFVGDGRYEGEWRDGDPHGQWLYFDGDGIRYESEWRDGKLHGNFDTEMQSFLRLSWITNRKGPPLPRFTPNDGC